MKTTTNSASSSLPPTSSPRSPSLNLHPQHQSLQRFKNFSVQAIFGLAVVVIVVMVSILTPTSSALTVPSGIAKFDRCANSTYACLSGSVEPDSGKLNYTIAYCCCYELFSTCKRTLGCDANSGASSAPGGSKKMKGSPESCTYLRNQETKIRKEKVCPPESSLKADCPSGAFSPKTPAIFILMAVTFICMLSVQTY